MVKHALSAWLDAEAVARGFGFVVDMNGTEYVRWDRVNLYLEGFGFTTSGKNKTSIKSGDLIPENMVYRLGFKANNLKEKD